MFCENCGSELKDGAKFCTVCGTRVVATPEVVSQDSFGAGEAAESSEVTVTIPMFEAPASAASGHAQAGFGPASTGFSAENAGSSPASAASGPAIATPFAAVPASRDFAEQMKSDRNRSRKKLSPLAIVVLVLALLAGTALAAVLITQQAGESGGTGGAAGVAASASAPAARELTEEEKVIASLDGWWQRGARLWLDDGYVYYDNGKRYRFSAEGEYEGTLDPLTTDMVHRHDNGLQGERGSAFINTPGYFIDVNHGSLGFFLTDDAPNSLSWLNEDGTGYSGGETIGRVDAPEWADKALATLETLSDGSGSTSLESASAASVSAASSPTGTDAIAAAEAKALKEAQDAGKTVLAGTLFVGTVQECADWLGRRNPNPGVAEKYGNYDYAVLVLDEPVTLDVKNADGGTVARNPYVSRTGTVFEIGNDWPHSTGIARAEYWAPYSGQRVTVAFSSFSSYSDSMGALFDINGTGERIAPLIEADLEAREQAAKATEQVQSGIDSPDGYVLADSNSRTYTRAELEKFDNHTLFLARNEIFARHGRQFANKELQQYFGGKSWYSGTISAADFDSYHTGELNDYERANSELMRSIETERNSPYL